MPSQRHSYLVFVWVSPILRLGRYGVATGVVLSPDKAHLGPDMSLGKPLGFFHPPICIFLSLTLWWFCVWKGFSPAFSQSPYGFVSFIFLSVSSCLLLYGGSVSGQGYVLRSARDTSFNPEPDQTIVCDRPGLVLLLLLSLPCLALP